MGLFGRRAEPERAAVPAPPDEELTFFTVDEAARFRRLVREVLAGMGREVEVGPQSVVTDDGREWGLWNVAASAHNDEDGDRAWPEVVRSHFEKTFKNAESSTQDLSDDEYRGALRMRLVEESPLAQLGADAFDHALEWAPGVVRVPVLDLPDSVATPPREDLERHGDLAGILDLAWRNTAALVGTEELVRERIEHEGRHVWCVFGESFFTASLALVLPDLVRRFEPGADLEQGVLFGVPYRHQVDYRVLDSSEAALDALVLLPGFVAMGYGDSPGPLSPHTYLWLDGAVTPVTAVAPDGTLTVTPGPHLEGLLPRG